MLVGLLFEICIVDASIFAIAVITFGGGWGCESVFGWHVWYSHQACCLCVSWLVPLIGGRVGVFVCMFVLMACVVLTLLRQAMKGTWWMPWHQEPMKDVGACDKPWGVGNQAVIRGCPNGETQHESCRVTHI